MSETKQASPDAVAGQVDRGVRPPAPTRAVRLTLKLDADDMRELSYALRTIADHAERGELTIGVSGGPCSGYIYELLQDPTITHDSYHAALRAYLDGLKAAKEAQMTTDDETTQPADAGPVQQRVRPLVERLRALRNATRWSRGLDLDYATAWEPDALCAEAADEIERLRAGMGQLIRERRGAESIRECLQSLLRAGA